MAILNNSEIAEALRYASPEDLPEAAFGISAAAEAFLASATGHDWGKDRRVDDLAKQAARILLVKWFDDPEQCGRSDGVYGLTNLIGLLQLEASRGEEESGG
jgi:hypothetical protein